MAEEAVAEVALHMETRVKIVGKVGSPLQGMQIIQGTRVPDFPSTSRINARQNKTSPLIHLLIGLGGHQHRAGL